MKFAVIQFPGSNCDQDCLRAINGLDGLRAEYVWHKATSLAGFDAVVLPGGFAYGDYLRCGAIARFSPIMNEVVRAAKEGWLVLGTCNGFQVLCEAGLLPGALVRNRGLRFVCDMVRLRIEVPDSALPTVVHREQFCECRLPTAKAVILPTPTHCVNSTPTDRS